MPINTALILLALLAQILFTFVVYVRLVRGRFLAVRNREARARQYVLVEGETSARARMTNNLRSQFELPVLFYVLVVMLVAIDRVTILDVVLAWAFVAARIAHHVVHTGSENLMARFRIFGTGLAIVGILGIHAILIVIGAVLA